MAFWRDVLSSVVPIGVFTPNVTYVGADGLSAALDIDGMSIGKLWKSQPHLRMVVSFVARNIAQLGLHTFERVSETDRRRSRDDPASRALSNVDGNMTTYDLIFALVGDLLLYDRAYWLLLDDASGNKMVRRLPPSWVTPVKDGAFGVKSYTLATGSRSETVPVDRVLAFTGYSPVHPGSGSSTVESLRDTIKEQIEATTYRQQVWKRGGRVSAVIERPKDAPAWSAEAAARFGEDWYASYTGHGRRAGGTPVLEDGMTLRRIDFNAREQQFVEAAKLSLRTVAGAYFVNPTMLGQTEGNYAVVKEYRKMLYGDTLGPYIKQIEERLNTFLLPMLGVDSSRFYTEFNIEAKLRGSFEDQALAFQSSVGAPWVTRAEARARMNLPAIDGADQLVVPLNVLTGGQASPRDSGSQNRNSRIVRVKERAESWDDRATNVLAKFFQRQERAVSAAMGAKAADWWDEDRWDRELSDNLMRLASAISEQIGPETAETLGFDPDDYDVDRTLAYLRKASDNSAASINAATRIQLEAALADDGDDDVPVAERIDSVWTVAKEQRSGAAGAMLVTFVSGFAVREAGKQTLGDRGRKTWVVTSGNPRASHAAMDGETVGLDETFSNGMKWPGDSDDADETAGCTCEISITRG